MEFYYALLINIIQRVKRSYAFAKTRTVVFVMRGSQVRVLQAAPSRTALAATATCGIIRKRRSAPPRPPCRSLRPAGPGRYPSLAQRARGYARELIPRRAKSGCRQAGIRSVALDLAGGESDRARLRQACALWNHIRAAGHAPARWCPGLRQARPRLPDCLRQRPAHGSGPGAPGQGHKAANAVGTVRLSSCRRAAERQRRFRERRRHGVFVVPVEVSSEMLQALVDQGDVNETNSSDLDCVGKAITVAARRGLDVTA